MAQIDEIGKDDEFALARKRAKQQATQNLQQRQQALKRRFAILGTGASGARLKAEEKAQETFGQELQQAEEAIGTAERGELRRRREIDEARQFQRGEREASQLFAGEQAKLGRQFARGEREASQLFGRSEREASQLFGADQARIGREFMTGERLSSQEFASTERAAAQEFASLERQAQEAFAAGESDKARELQKELFQKQFDFENQKFQASLDQFKQTFDLEKYVTDRNLEFAERMLRMQEKGGFFEQLAGGLGSGDAGIGTSGFTVRKPGGSRGVVSFFGIDSKDIFGF